MTDSLRRRCDPLPTVLRMALELIIVDAFTDRAFAGNPAAVAVLEAPLAQAAMQAVAAEVNLAETAFLSPNTRLPGDWDLRWFTPATEVDLCGHANWHRPMCSAGLAGFRPEAGCCSAPLGLTAG